jgi:hypothetical protein
MKHVECMRTVKYHLKRLKGRKQLGDSVGNTIIIKWNSR